MQFIQARISKMNWRYIADRAANSMLGSWRFPLQTGERLWRLQSSCNQTREAIQENYEGMTKKQVKQVIAKIDGKLTPDLNLPLADGMFNNYPDILKQLNTSKFICYRFGGVGEHFVTYLYDQTGKVWIPIQAWQGVISLADWLKLFTESNLYDQVQKISNTGKRNPITHPYSYWQLTWFAYIQQFNLTQLKEPKYEALKKQKEGQLLNARDELVKDGRTITWAFCDSSQTK